MTQIQEWPGRKKTSYVGEPLTKFWLLASVGETDYDYGLTWTGKTGYLEETLAKFWLITSFGETDSDSGVIWTGKNKLRGVTPCKILFHRLSWWNWLNIKKSQLGNPLNNYSYYLHLDHIFRSWTPIGYVRESKRRLPTLSRASLIQQTTPTPDPRRGINT